ncbi:hypothetical protein EVY06_07885 [Citrobacter koseri]|uniref:Uncharacterized protein n=1 Tax=Citrobacter koseri TaxID=545 RepID=A0AAQ0V6Y1_CITKO|nr:hypothetical protein AM351_17555 [Citrobacter koseri]AVK73983.1 hypothetical protein CEP66_24610 [Citrobacter koseri]PNN12228.1 hypothetical protein AL526_005635 [Citrobacter koseri]RSC17406.1 hypothetical protein EGS84_10825 [Citrobacter koseri]RZB01169.1 hypothetical protein EVY06_07885 [Citrobacter koseri]
MLTIWFTLPHKLTNCVCRPDKAFMPPSGNFARGATLAGPMHSLPILSRIARAIFAPDHRNFSCLR